MSVPFTRLVVLVTLAGHGRGIARPRDPAAQERTSSTCVPHYMACNDLQYSPRVTAMNFMQYQHDGVGDANARVGQTRGSVRRLCHTAPVAPRSNTGRASSLRLSPQRGQLTSSPCSFKVSAGRSATEPRPPIFLAPQDPFERPEAWEGKGLWAGAGLAYGLTNCGVRSTVCTGMGNQPQVPRMPNVPHAKAHTTPTHPSPSLHLRAEPRRKGAWRCRHCRPRRQ